MAAGSIIGDRWINRWLAAEVTLVKSDRRYIYCGMLITGQRLGEIGAVVVTVICDGPNSVHGKLIDGVLVGCVYVADASSDRRLTGRIWIDRFSAIEARGIGRRVKSSRRDGQNDFLGHIGRFSAPVHYGPRSFKFFATFSRSDQCVGEINHRLALTALVIRGHLGLRDIRNLATSKI